MNNRVNHLPPAVNTECAPFLSLYEMQQVIPLDHVRSIVHGLLWTPGISPIFGRLPEQGGMEAVWGERRNPPPPRRERQVHSGGDFPFLFRSPPLPLTLPPPHPGIGTTSLL